MQQQPQQPPLSPTQQTPPLTTAPVTPSVAAANNARSNRLLYRRGLPDLPELIEAEDEDVTAADSTSMNTFSTRHSTNTSTSSRDFLSHSASGSISEAFKNSIPPLTRPSQPSHDIYSQTPPGSVPQLQTPFEYVPSSSFRVNGLLQKEASPPPSPTSRDEVLANAGMGYGLGVNLTTSETYHSDANGMLDEAYHESGMEGEGYGENECILEGCPECSGLHSSQAHSFGPYHRSSSSGEVNASESGEYMSPPSSPGTDYEEDNSDGFYGLSAQSFPSLDRPRSPSLLIDNDTFSSVPALPTFPPYPSRPVEASPESPRQSRGLLGRRGTAVLNNLLPRSLRLKRWASTPALPKLQISSPPFLPRRPSVTNVPSPTQGSRTPGPPPVPPNTAFDYDPWSDRQSDDEDDYDSRRPTTRGTMMSREQLPTPPFLPTVASTLPYIPQLDSPMSISFPQSPSASVHNLVSPPLFPQLQQQTVRNNSLTSLSNQELTSNTPIASPTFASPHQRPFDIHSPAIPSPIATLGMSSLRSIATPQHSPQLTHRQFPSIPSVAEDVEDLLQQMDLEDNAFAATEQRMATSGWSTETELGELRAKRHVVRREWEERIETARKKRRGSEGGVSSHGSTHGTVTSEGTATPVITLYTSPNVSMTQLPVQPPQP